MSMTTRNLRVQVGPQRAVNPSRLATAGTVAAAALLLTACSGSSGGSSSPAVASTPPVTEMPPMTSMPSMPGMPPMTGGAPMTVTAVEKDFSIELSEKTFAPGTLTFRVQNQGSSPHDLSIKGPGVATAKSQVIDSGATSELTVTLEPGTYQLWCSVDGHRAKGMDTTITVG
ncbi:MAG: cupredoxin domain-containing protein [Pseudonocardiaceae bacterium]